jgi:hypothetical protein
MWKRGPPLPSGIGGGEKPHEELPLSVMLFEKAEEAVESDEEIEKEDEYEDKSHVDMKRSSAMAAPKKNRVFEFLSRNFCLSFCNNGNSPLASGRLGTFCSVQRQGLLRVCPQKFRQAETLRAGDGTHPCPEEVKTFSRRFSAPGERF